ncbi:MAG: OmpA family protein [Bacteroidales bacterium]|nr:OmpA family protein [Bacteroidales bacterium]MCF8454618.1 OmpA family protein [Bacteroidales bacterium]
MKKSQLNIFLFLMIVLVGHPPLSAQESARKLRNKAEKAYNDKNYYQAIDYYRQYCMQKPDDTKTLYLLADLQRYTRDYRRAKLNYQGVYKSDPKKYPLALFYYASMLKQLGEYEKAKVEFSDFIQVYKGKEIDRDIKKQAILEMEGCDLAMHLLDSALEVVVVHADTSINKSYSEFSPLQINDSTLIYATMRSDSLIENFSSTEKQFYTAKKKGREWQFTGKMEGPFNSEKHITGNGVFSASGKRFYFTRCNKMGEGLPRCELYQSVLEDGVWQDPIRIGNGVNAFGYTATQPAVATYSKGAGKEVIYFVSDRPDGRGGLDIWYTIYDVFEKSFLEPSNAGRKINSPGDEITPFFEEANRTLYFSSNGHPGMGGFDIYRTQGEKRNWTPARNIGYPLNSSFDDLYFSVYNRKQGFFTSNRDGGIAFEGQNCCDDIYSYYWAGFIDLALTGEVREAEAIEDGLTKTIENANVNLYLDEAGTDEPILLKVCKTSPAGIYFFDIEPGKAYSLLVTKEGFFSKQFPVSAREINYSDTLDYPVTLDRIPEKPIVIEHVYFAYGSHELSDTAKLALDNYLLKLMMENPDISLEIFAHTDSKGPEDFNLKLSQKRAQSIVDYLTKKGISQKRLIAIGYGESKPVAPNANPDGTDNPEGRKLNRRIELNVVK